MPGAAELATYAGTCAHLERKSHLFVDGQMWSVNINEWLAGGPAQAQALCCFQVILVCLYKSSSWGGGGHHSARWRGVAGDLQFPFTAVHDGQSQPLQASGKAVECFP